MNEMAVQRLVQYVENMPQPEISWPKHWFDEICFSKWAAEELIQSILDHPTIPAQDTVEEFALKMLAYSSISDEKALGGIFSIAAQFAWDCLENLIPLY